MGNIKLTNVKAESEIKTAENMPVFQPAEKKEPFKVVEIKEKREECVKHFKMSDGTYRAEIYAYPVHYFDESSNSFLDITNDLVEENDKFVTKHKHFNVEFNKNASDHLFSLSKNDCSISLKKHNTNTLNVQNNLSIAANSQNNFMLEKADAVLLRNFNDKTDLEYKIEDNRVKENIIVNEKKDRYEFEFELACANLTVSLSADQHSLEFKDLNNTVVFIIPEPFMYDSNGEKSNDVYYELIPQNSNNYLLKVTANEDWINAEERKFPITIDPAINVPFNDKIRKFQKENNVFREVTGDIYAGVTPDGVIARAYFAIDVPIIVGANVKSANISVTLSHTELIDVRFSVHNVISPFKEWINSVKIGNVIAQNDIYAGTNCIEDNIYINIAELIQEHFEQKNFYGICIKAKNEQQITSTQLSQVTLDCITLSYTIPDTHYSYLNSIEFTAGEADKLKVDLYENRYRLIHNNLLPNNSIIPVNHVYDSKLDKNYYCGKKWKLNLNQSLINDRKNDWNYDNYNKTIEFVDDIGVRHLLEEKYFYVENNKKYYVDKNELEKDNHGYLRDTSFNYLYNNKSVIRAYQDKDNKYILFSDDDRAYFLNEIVKPYKIIKDFKKYYYNEFGQKIYLQDNNAKQIKVDVYFAKLYYNELFFKEYEVPFDKIFIKEGKYYFTALDSRDYEVIKKSQIKNIVNDSFAVSKGLRINYDENNYVDPEDPYEVIYTYKDIYYDYFNVGIGQKDIQQEFLTEDIIVEEQKRYFATEKVKEMEDCIKAYYDAIDEKSYDKIISNKTNRLEYLLEKQRTNDIAIQTEIINNDLEINSKQIETTSQYIDYIYSQRNDSENNDELASGKKIYNEKEKEKYVFDMLKNAIKYGWKYDKKTYYVDLENAQNQLKSLQNNEKKLNYQLDFIKGNDEITFLQDELSEMQNYSDIPTLSNLNNRIKEAELNKTYYEQMRNRAQNKIEQLVLREKRSSFDTLKEVASDKYYCFNYFGEFVEVGDKYKNVQIKYDDLGKINSILDSDNQYLVRFNYTNNFLDSIIDAEGRATSYKYENNNLIAIVYPDGRECKYVYDDLNQLVETISYNGQAIELKNNVREIIEKNHLGIISKDNLSLENTEEIKKRTYIDYFCGYNAIVRSDGYKIAYNFQNDGILSSIIKTKEQQETNQFNSAVCYINSTEKTIQYNITKSAFTEKNLIQNFDVEGAWQTDSIYNYIENGILYLHGECPYSKISNNIQISKLISGKNYMFFIMAKADAENALVTNSEATFKTDLILNYSDGTSNILSQNFSYLYEDWQPIFLPVTIDSNKILSEAKVEIWYTSNKGIAKFANICLIELAGKEEIKEDGLITMQTDFHNKIEYEYTANNLPSTITYTDESGKVVIEKHFYNGKNELFRKAVFKDGNEDGGNGIITEYTYDEYGNVTEECTYHENDTTNKMVTKNSVDERGRLKEEFDVRGEIEGMDAKSIYTYFGDTNKVKCVESTDGVKTYFAYDYLNDQLIGKTVSVDGEDNTIRYHYTAGYLTEIANNDGTSINYVYDGRGRTKEILINGQSYLTNSFTESTTDNVKTEIGEMTYVSGEKFRVTTVDGKVTKQEYAAPNGSYLTLSEFVYDFEDKLIETEDKVSLISHTFEYDEDDNLKKHTFGSNEHTYEIGEDGDILGETFILDKNGVGEATLNYSYEYADTTDKEVIEISTPLGLTNVLDYDLLGRMRSVKYKKADGSTAHSQYIYYLKSGDHTTSMISSVRYGTGSSISEQVKYRYDKFGNISCVLENGKQVVRYRYDALNRLIREDNAKLNKTVVYSYDNNGNLLSKSLFNYTLSETLSTENNEILYAYDGEYWKDLLTSYNGEECVYDVMGNPTLYRGHSFTWEKGRQLKKITLDEENTITFTYDAAGMRTSKNGTTYVYEDGKLLKQSDGQNTVYFIYDESGYAGIKVTGEKAGNYYFRKNILGDVTHIYDENGNVCARYEYNAWGECEITEDNADGIGALNPIRYRSYYYDTETGLYYLKTRYYDPEVGRFINADDVEIVMLTKDHVNGIMMYNYCANNPVMEVDSSGTAILSILIGLGIAAVTFAAVNTGSQLVSDVVNYATTGSWESGWEDYLGAFIGGLAGGATFFLTKGNLKASLAVMSGVDTLSTKLLTNTTGKTDYSGLEIVGSTAFSFGSSLILTGLFGIKTKTGLTKGVNSYLAIWKGGLTKLRNGTVGRMSLNVAIKGLRSIVSLRLNSTFIGGLLSGVLEWINWLMGKDNKIGYL